jgi:uncharacterized protein (TIGR02001 family)
MRPFLIALPALLWASSAAGATDWSTSAGIVSDYRFRGISLSHGRPAVQGSVMVEDSSGLYAALWGSTLGHGSDTELDLSGGYDAEVSDQVDLDVSANLYTYPSGSDVNYVELAGAATFTRGPASGKVEVSYVPAQGRTRANAYALTAGTYAIPKTPVSLTASLGYERGWFDEVEHGGKWDWSLGVEVEAKPAKLCLTYVESNADLPDRRAILLAAFLNW